MKIASRIILVIFISFIALFIMGTSVQNGRIVDNPVKTPGYSALNYYALPTAQTSGDCLSWETACTFRTAVAKCPGTKPCTVYVGGGVHDLNNGSDALGTTVSANYVYIKGAHPVGAIGQESKFVNSANAVTSTLVLTGNYCTVEGIDFDNTGYTDEGTIFLHVKGSYTLVQDCLFRQVATAPAGTGIKYENSGVSLSLRNNRFRRLKDYGVDIGAASRLYAVGNHFVNCGVGIYASNSSADETYWDKTLMEYCTTAYSLNTAAAKKHVFVETTFVGNTTNVAAFNAYAPDITFRVVHNAGNTRYAYPAGTAGGAASTGYKAITTGAGVQSWAYGDYATIVPINTITRPYNVVGVSIHNWNAAQVFRLNIAYGSSDPGQAVSLGQWDVSLPNAGTNAVKVQFDLEVYVPAYAGIGGRIMTSTGASDELDIALLIEEI